MRVIGTGAIHRVAANAVLLKIAERRMGEI
jgi:hypothetical protein